MAVTCKKDGRWAVYYRQDKKVKWEYFGRGAAAKAAAHARNHQLGLGRRKDTAPPAGPCFLDIAAAYVASRKNANPRLVVELDANLVPFFGHMQATRITHHDLDRYVAKRRKSVKDSTINRELTDLKSIMNWAAQKRPPLIPINPVRDYRKPAPDYVVIMPPTADELQRILSAARPHLVRAITLSYYTGLRPGSVELLALRWDRVDWTAATLLVVSAKKGGIGQRAVPIHDGLLPLLQEWFKADKKKKGGPIIHWAGKQIKDINRAWRNAKKRAGITRRLRLYDLRHAHITLALESGADIGALSQVVGSRPETLRKHYQHVTNQLRRATVALIPPLKSS